MGLRVWERGDYFVSLVLTLLKSIQAVPQIAEADDDADGDDGGDQAVFDDGGTGLIPHKTCEESCHDSPSSGRIGFAPELHCLRSEGLCTHK